MEWWDHVDDALVIQRDTFGEPIVLVASDGTQTSAVGIFDAPPTSADLGTVAGLSNQAAWLGLRVRDLPNALAPYQGDRIDIRGASWEVADVQPDGSGHIRCQLFRVGPGATAPLPPLSPEPTETTAARWSQSRWSAATWAGSP